MATHIQPLTHERRRSRATDLVRWGPVVAGVFIGLAFFGLFSSLWLALAANSGDGWFSDALGWWIGTTGAVALFVAGFTAGMLAGVRGMGAGLANGLTAWGLTWVLSVTAVVPGSVNLTNNLSAGLDQGQNAIGSALGSAGGGFTVQSALWVAFGSLAVGCALAAAGGVLGGALRRPAVVADEETRDGEVAGTARETRMADNYAVDREPARTEAVVAPDREGLTAPEGEVTERHEVGEREGARGRAR